MKTLTDRLLGNSPWTSILGLLISILMVIKPLLESGQTDVWVIASAVLTALFGRKAADTAPVSPKEGDI